jgi:YHS domain-containing protein
MLYDPICGKRVEEHPKVLSAEYKQKRYFFCSERCKRAFEHEAEKLRMGELARIGALLNQGKVRWGLA